MASVTNINIYHSLYHALWSVLIAPSTKMYWFPIYGVIVLLCSAVHRCTAIDICKGGVCNTTETSKVVCYVTNWVSSRPGKSVYHVSDIDSSLCTHLVYSFAKLNPTTLTIEPGIPKVDINEKLYEQVTSLKTLSKGLKVSLALGGWADSANSTKYSDMINSGRNRANFIHSAVQFLRKHNFDGLDIDWEYPKCWQGKCTAGPISDKRNFVSLIQELRLAFRDYKLLLSVAVSANRTVAAEAYSFKRLGLLVDWVGIMTYDYTATLKEKTGYHAPFTGPIANAVDSIQMWLDEGVPPEKLIMGIPLYGRSFTLTEPSFHGVGAPATVGKQGPFTEELGFLAFFEFCNGWNYKSERGVGSYAFLDNQWVSYDNVENIQDKVAYAKKSKLGGVMVWALDLDDFSGDFCNFGKYPLMKTINNALIQ